jgi:protein TonB
MRKAVSEVVNGQLLAPSRIPRSVKIIEEQELPPAGSVGVVGGVEGGVPGSQTTGVLASLLSSTHSAVAPAVATPKRIAISTGVSEGLILTRVDPEYPFIAKRAHVEGTVQLKAIISREGLIENLQLMNGHPLLVPSAMEAVKQWRYRPYTLNGNPVEVETVINVHFTLGA